MAADAAEEGTRRYFFMFRFWLKGVRKYLAITCVTLLAMAGVSRAEDKDADLRRQLAEQAKQIQELKQMIQNGGVQSAAADTPKLDDAAVKKIVESYLKDNPGAGMPPSVQTGYSSSTGFAIRSTNDPKYIKWDDDCKIPFELRIRGRIQADYYYYKTEDTFNHLTHVRNTQNFAPGKNDIVNTSPDFSQLEIKRTRLVFAGTAFDPNFRYWIELDGNTRGISGLAGGGLPGTNGLSTIGSNGGAGNTGAIPGGNTIATVDHAVRLFSSYIAYDFHPCWGEKGCGPECAPGTVPYVPTLTAIVGKFKPYFSFEETLGSANQQFVEYGMSEWFFDADDDNLMMQAALQYKGMEDRLYATVAITNGNETQIANVQMDDLPGVNFGFWYDFGGNWNEARKRWDLYGGSVSDLEWSYRPVVRIGAMANLVPMDRRTEFTAAELNRVRAVPGQPGGTTFINLLNGGNINPNAAGIGQFAADAFDSYTYESYVTGHWRGFSFLNDWWIRDLNNFRGRRGPNGNFPGNGFDQPIIYTANGNNSLFPARHGIIDYGTMLQGGYFIVPKKLEIAGRWSWIRGESGNIYGNGTFTNVVVPGAGTVRRYNAAFDKFQEANEYAVGVNYYFHGQQLKWQTDLSYYNGGNPAGGGQSPAGFTPGVDGYMLRTQVQFAF
jgi:hypothetical protein